MFFCNSWVVNLKTWILHDYQQCFFDRFGKLSVRYNTRCSTPHYSCSTPHSSSIGSASCLGSSNLVVQAFFNTTLFCTPLYSVFNTHFVLHKGHFVFNTTEPDWTFCFPHKDNGHHKHHQNHQVIAYLKLSFWTRRNCWVLSFSFAGLKVTHWSSQQEGE